jgi:two-component system sensor histidine kinase RegB
MLKMFKRSNQVYVIITLRSIAVAIQLLLIAFVNFGLDYQLPWAPLLTIIAIEVLFTLASFGYYQLKHATEQGTNQSAILLQISADIIFLSLLLFFSGGATNAFVSLLLIPIAIAAVTLPTLLLAVVCLLALSSYSILLSILPMSTMHGNMQGHFIGMGINFLFSTLVVAIVVGKMARNNNQQALAIAAYRENLLKQEKITALGVASAQVTHQLATPIATVQLLSDELEEDFPNHPIIIDMQSQLSRCKNSLDDFRQQVFDIKEQVIKSINCQRLFNEVIESININTPEIEVSSPSDEHQILTDKISINADAALLPAVMNLVNNAIIASKQNQSTRLSLYHKISDKQWHFSIRDYGKGFSINALNDLGVKPVNSEYGFGMAVFLSHVSLERLGGKLVLTNHQDGGALVTLSLPLMEASTLTIAK